MPSDRFLFVSEQLKEFKTGRYYILHIVFIISLLYINLRSERIIL